MALENDDLIIVQKSDGSHAKATVGDIASDAGVPDLQAVTDVGSNTTNSITLDADKIVLNADGSATFAGSITQNSLNKGQDSSGTILNPVGLLNLQRASTSIANAELIDCYYGTTQTFRVECNGDTKIGANNNITLKGSDGSATFAGKVQATGYRIDQLPTITSSSP